MFFASGTIIASVHPSYIGGIVFNGDTAKGQMKLTIKNITKQDAGIYTATSAGAPGPAIYQGPTLYVFGIPTKPFKTELSSPIINNNLQLNCTSTSTTVPGHHNLSILYRWNVDEVNLSSSSGRYILSGSHVTIQNIQVNDTKKIITCTAREQGGLESDESNKYVLESLYKPVITNTSITQEPSTDHYILIGLTVGIVIPVFVASVVVTVYLYRRRKQKNQTDQMHEMTQCEDIGNKTNENVYQGISLEGKFY
ncbi:hypothetical protein KUTeg_011277 [Tegillarca granosa]|uniref:Ig-like domain-containing protein n=1 Tax=Tegillarca granosa TaxID=220873 RepID=A0ABQ9F3N7_TEGGR|nr:hypothetical protein KUTeg_011277 [Tegillarca granosa]